MNALGAFIAYLLSWVLGIVRVALGIVRSMAMLATIGLAGYWWATRKPYLISWAEIAFGATFVSFLARYATFEIEARLRRSIRAPAGYTL